MKKLGILLIALGIFVPLATTVVTFVLPETFASSAKLLHPAGSPAPLVVAVGKMMIGSNLNLVVSHLNLNAQWGKKYNMPGELSAEKCQEKLRRMVQVQLPRRASIIEIKVFSDDSHEAATIANELAKIYLRSAPGTSVIDRAEANPAPVRPNKRLNIGIGIFIGATFLTAGIGLLIASRIAVKRPE